MLVREMHIEFSLKCQKIDSNHYDTFLPEEIDWLLNLAQHQVIKTRSTKKSTRKQEGFFDTYKRVEDLEELVTNAVLPAYTKDVANKETVFSLLPANFFGMVNHRANVLYNCNGLAISSVAAVHKVAKVLMLESVPTPPTNPYSGFTVTLTTNAGSQTLFSLASFITGGLTVKEQRYYVVHLLMEEINRGTSGVKVYWNSFNDSINNSQLVFVSTNSTHVSITLTLHTAATPVTATFATSGFSQFSTATNTRGFKKAARVADNEFLYKMLDNPFHSTRHDNVLLSYENNTIVAHQKPTFIVSQILIDYIRKPQMINLALHRDCELHNKIHDEIVDKAVQLAQAYIGAESYKTIINESLLNE